MEEAALLLIDRGAVSTLPIEDFSALHAAAGAGLHSVVKTLVARGVDPNKLNKGYTCAQYAANECRGDVSIFTTLALVGVNMSSRGEPQQEFPSPLDIALCTRNLRAVLELIRQGAEWRSIRKQPPSSITLRGCITTKYARGPYAVVEDSYVLGCSREEWDQAQFGLVQFLLNQGCDPNERPRNKDGQPGPTPLNNAVYYDCAKPLVELLLQRGADVNAQSRNLTPLWWLYQTFDTKPCVSSVFNNRKNTMILLLESGAKFNPWESPARKTIAKELMDLIVEKGPGSFEFLMAHVTDRNVSVDCLGLLATELLAQKEHKLAAIIKRHWPDVKLEAQPGEIDGWLTRAGNEHDVEFLLTLTTFL